LETKKLRLVRPAFQGEPFRPKVPWVLFPCTIGGMKNRALLLTFVLVSLRAWGEFDPNGLVILHTDYGADSVYVGVLKGAIYKAFPQARIDAITNSVPPFDILAGAQMLSEAAGEFPAGTVFCCVVDPGVGTSRKRIVLETKSGHAFVAPDNGLLTLAARRLGIAQVREIANAALWRGGEVSHTFHGRDIFGPVSAALARGVPLAEIGPALESMVTLDIPEPRLEDGRVVGAVIRSDPYGNLITNITADHLSKAGLTLGDTADVQVGTARFSAPWVGAYGDVPEDARLLVIQSSGYVELAVNMRSLADAIGEGLHAPVTISAKNGD